MNDDYVYFMIRDLEDREFAWWDLTVFAWYHQEPFLEPFSNSFIWSVCLSINWREAVHQRIIHFYFSFQYCFEHIIWIRLRSTGWTFSSHSVLWIMVLVVASSLYSSLLLLMAYKWISYLKLTLLLILDTLILA